MRIVIIALGSRGDVQPYIALGKGLQAAGHAVRLLSHQNYENLVASNGLEFWPVQGDVQAFAATPEMRARLENGSFIAVMGYAAKAAQAAMLDWAKEGLRACRGMDLIVAGFGGMFTGFALEEKLAIPLLQAHYVPFTPTRMFPGALFPAATARLGGAANLLSHHLTRQLMWQQIRSADRAARRRIFDLPAAPFFGPFNAQPIRKTPVLYGFSPAVVPKPSDWGQNIHITGYWFLDADPDWEPPESLQAFLARGPKPIYIGFGSMASRKSEETAHIILSALEQTGQRAVLLSGWSGLRVETLPKSVYLTDSVPHDWLFDRVSAVVHHGGAGTTAAGLRAGVPSIIIPFFADQPFWGRRVADLGVGHEPIPRNALSVDHLVQAIEVVTTDSGMRQRAAALGEKIQTENGVARAVEIIEKVI